MDNVKNTFLYQKHLKLGANLTNFGGFNMPLFYTTIALEHEAVRNNIGVFDVSHMGQIIIKGSDAYKYANYILSNKIIKSTKITYSFLLNELGGIIDDLMVYPLNDNEVMLVVNAGNIDKDYSHLIKHKKDFNVDIINQSDNLGCLAIQGPNSFNVLSNYYNELPKYSNEFLINNNIIISRSGYTGEDGFEVYGDETEITKLWDYLIKNFVTPIGLGARDTLRFEAAMPLYGNELTENINPIEAGLSFAVDFNKDSFIGKDALVKAKENQKRKIVALELIERNIAREGYLVYKDNKEIGYITTGYLTPTTKKALAFALIDIKYANIDQTLTIKIRKKDVKAKVRNKNFIKKNNKI